MELNIYHFQHWDDIVELLQCCPKLQILSIKKVNFFCFCGLLICVPSFLWVYFTNLIFVYVLQSALNRDLSVNWTYPNHVPECISSHLRSCTINYEGWKDELQFTKYILLNARLLEVMKININRKSDRRPLDELSSCPMISSECKVLIDFWPCLLIFSNHAQKLKLVKWKCMNGFIISLSLPLFGLFNFIDYRWFDTLQISNVVSLVVLRFAIKHPFWIASFHSVIIGWFFKVSYVNACLVYLGCFWSCLTFFFFFKSWLPHY
jgi:hypothetical protein